MGGSAFSSRGIPLSTPRMPPAVYREVRDRCHAVLREHFLCVASPIEGPAKEDHGDVDILVALEKPMIFPAAPADQVEREGKDVLAAIRESLGAEYMIIEPGDQSANLAIPWPEHLPLSSDTPTPTTIGIPLDGGQGQKQQGQQQRLHIQVDVRICPTVAQLQWALFKHAHGDFWNLVGTTIRPLGLTVDEDALWLRIPEIEEFNRNRSKVRLTADPAATLDFLGFDAAAASWEEPFASVRDLFEYVASCRWFWVAPDAPGDEGEAHKKKLKANDRRRMKFRPIFRAWVEEFLPKCRAEGRYLVEDPPEAKERTRRLVREEALARFGVRAEYDGRLHAWRAERQRDEIRRSAIKAGVPTEGLDPAYRSCLVRALRRILLPDEEDGGAGARPDLGIVPAAPVRLPDGLYDVAAARDFVNARWEDVGKAAWAAHLARATGHSGPAGLNRKAEEKNEEE